jgi:transcription initiation factor IIE alpha subunit
MAKVIGYDQKVFKKFTCPECGAIVEYAPKEDQFTDKTDEGTKIKGLNCPGCGAFHRTNY